MTSDVKKNKKEYLSEKFFLRTHPDYQLILVLLLINAFGIIMIYSASYYFAVASARVEENHFFVSQVLFASIGIVLMIAVSFFRPRHFQLLWFLALVLSLAATVAVRIPRLGHAVNGAYRWIKVFGMTLQIAEPVKLGMIVGISGFICAMGLKRIRNSVAVLMVGALISLLLLALSNNLSTAIIVMAMVFFMLTLNHPRAKRLWIIFAIAIVLVILAVIIILNSDYHQDENFRITRIRAWWDKDNPLFANAEAFQATQALYAVASGGFFGKGLGQSLLKFKLPEPHNDYILAIIFEELGIFGVILLTALFVFLLYRIFLIYEETKDRFSKLMVLGVFTHMAVQIVLNYAVTLGILPTMGVTLPFISAGGSSVVFTFLEFGLVLSVQRQNAEERLYSDAFNDMESYDPYYKQLRDEKRRRREQK